jgi:hypothetical protein
MEMNSAKILDEVCNLHNDAYSDEALYAEWVEPHRNEREPGKVPAPQFGEAVRANVEAFMARLCACQG